MNKPNIDIPSGFAENGTKEDFPNDKILNGFDPINPDILPGDCLNKFIDDTYKGLNGVLELYEGCVLYDSTVTYTNKSLVFDIDNNKINLFHSKQNENLNHPLTDTNWWQKVNLGGSTRNVGELVTALLPLTDAGLHLLDGTRLSGDGIYKGFVDYVAELYAENPNANYFTTETNWQSSVSTYGSCGKFVYDSTNNTVRLPKVSDILQCTTDLNALGDLIEAGLPSITHYHSGTTAGAGNHQHSITLDSGWGESPFNYVSLKWDNGDRIKYTGQSAYTSWSGDHAHNFTTGNNSAVSSVYGKNSKVQPQTINGLVYIAIANSTKTEIEVDIDSIATDVNGKADKDLSNITSIAPVLGMLQNTDSSQAGYLMTSSLVTASVYAPSGGKWLVLKNNQVNLNTAVVYEFGGVIKATVGQIVNGGDLVAEYTTQAQQSNVGLNVTLLKIQ